MKYTIRQKKQGNSEKDEYTLNHLELSYLVRMADALEHITVAQQKVYGGESDGFDFADEVEAILDRT